MIMHSKSKTSVLYIIKFAILRCYQTVRTIAPHDMPIAHRPVRVILSTYRAAAHDPRLEPHGSCANNTFVFLSEVVCTCVERRPPGTQSSVVVPTVESHR